MVTSKCDVELEMETCGKVFGATGVVNCQRMGVVTNSVCRHVAVVTTAVCRRVCVAFRTAHAYVVGVRAGCADCASVGMLKVCANRPRHHPNAYGSEQRVAILGGSRGMRLFAAKSTAAEAPREVADPDAS